MTQLAPKADFPHYYSRAIQRLGIEYKDTEFLYPSNGPWPQQSFDHPFGMSPAVPNIPKQEDADWKDHVGDYYAKSTVSFGFRANEYMKENAKRNGVAGYTPLAAGIQY